jgi:hypothetical protein
MEYTTFSSRGSEWQPATIDCESTVRAPYVAQVSFLNCAENVITSPVADDG